MDDEWSRLMDDEWIRLIVIVALCLIAIGGGVVGVVEWRTGNACTALGYPHSRVLYPSFAAYCIKRQDQTDIVVPLDKAQRAP